MDELSSSQVSAEQFGSQSNREYVEWSKKPAATQENNNKIGAENNGAKGLEHHHSRVPPISLQVNATACAGDSGYPRQWC